jgi:hypothetical protein
MLALLARLRHSSLWSRRLRPENNSRQSSACACHLNAWSWVTGQRLRRLQDSCVVQVAGDDGTKWGTLSHAALLDERRLAREWLVRDQLLCGSDGAPHLTGCCTSASCKAQAGSRSVR